MLLLVTQVLHILIAVGELHQVVGVRFSGVLHRRRRSWGGNELDVPWRRRGVITSYDRHHLSGGTQRRDRFLSWRHHDSINGRLSVKNRAVSDVASRAIEHLFVSRQTDGRCGNTFGTRQTGRTRMVGGAYHHSSGVSARSSGGVAFG